jgi:hypothetical protein
MTGVLIGLGLGLFIGVFVGAMWGLGARFWTAAATGLGMGAGVYLAGAVIGIVVRLLDRQSQAIKAGNGR